MEVGKSKILIPQTGDPGKSRCYSSSPNEGQQQQNFLLLRGGGPFVPFRPSGDWRRPIHIMEGNLLCSKCTDFDVNLIEKHPHRNIRNNS